MGILCLTRLVQIQWNLDRKFPIEYLSMFIICVGPFSLQLQDKPSVSVSFDSPP